MRQLITNTGWGTGLDVRTNPGFGHPFWANFLPVTRAVPEPPSIRGAGPPAIGPSPLSRGTTVRRAAVRRRTERRCMPRPLGRLHHDPRNAAMKDNLSGAVVRLTIFVVVCAFGTFGLLMVFAQFRFQQESAYNAEFTNVSGLEEGNFVRVAGVEVGKVDNISITHDNVAVVEFSADDSVILTEGTKALIRYDNLIGGRYVELQEGTGGVKRLHPGQTIPVNRTAPALDLDALIGGFRPLFRALNPEQVNALSGQLIQAFQGQGATIGSFLAQTAALTNTLADRDDLIGQVIVNLNTVLGSLGDQSDQFGKSVDSLSELVQGLAERKTDISNSIAHTNAAAGTIADLLDQARPAFKTRCDAIRPDQFDHRRRPRVRRRPAEHAARRVSGARPPRDLRRLLQLLSVRHGAQAQRQGRKSGVRQGGRPDLRAVHTQMKSFSERSPFVIGAVGVALIAAMVWLPLNYTKLPGLQAGQSYSAYFTEASGLQSGAAVQVSGFQVGEISRIGLDGPAGLGHVRRGRGHPAG